MQSILRGFSFEKYSLSPSVDIKRSTILNGKYAKGVPLLSKMVYKMVRVCNGHQGGASPYSQLPLLRTLSGPRFGVRILARVRNNGVREKKK